MSEAQARQITSYTQPLTTQQAEVLRGLLLEQGFEMREKQYALFSGKKGKVQVTVYEKGPKVLVQGKETRDFVQFTLEPLVLGEAKLGYEEELDPEMFEPHIGIDESGKGDFFGPLVIAAAYTNKQAARHLLDQGIQDSKKIGSDARIKQLADVIRETPGLRFELVSINPLKYNELYRKIGNLNRLLAWGHARVLENLLAKAPDCRRAISDQFARPEVLKRNLMEKGRQIELVQKTKAESDLAVAAASILAREKFVLWLENASSEYQTPMPKGASAKVREVARQLIGQHGRGILEDVAKTHFKTAAELLEESP
jgi:ribonuclease HIII